MERLQETLLRDIFTVVLKNKNVPKTNSVLYEISKNILIRRYCMVCKPFLIALTIFCIILSLKSVFLSNQSMYTTVLANVQFLAPQNKHLIEPTTVLKPFCRVHTVLLLSVLFPQNQQLAHFTCYKYLIKFSLQTSWHLFVETRFESENLCFLVDCILL